MNNYHTRLITEIKYLKECGLLDDAKELQQKADNILKILKIRDKYSLSQRQLGILLGCSNLSIYRLENGLRKVTRFFLSALSHVEHRLENGSVKIPE
jgi:DNA-binding XRE family transcriptional regulator